MKVVSLKVRNFMTYQELDLRPPEGLTLVTGPNGSGKSSAFVEAVTWILYGETVRGTSPTGEGELVARIGDREYQVVRSRRGKDTKLHFEDNDTDESLDGQTNTQTQARICAVFGSYERHVSSRVFSREHVARFAAATDKGRKALLEEALGLGRFDAALALLRQDLRAAQKEAVTVDTAAARAEGHLQACQERVDRLAAEPPPPAVPAGELEGLRRLLEEARGNERAAVEALEANRRAAATERATKAASEKQIGQLKAKSAALRAKADQFNGGACPVCSQPVDRERIQEHYAGALAVIRGELVDEELEVERCDRALVELLDEGNQLGQQRIECRSAVAVLEKEADRLERAVLAADRYARDSREAGEALAAARVAHGERAGAAEATLARVRALEAAEAVLGLRGARTMMFSRGLARMESRANASLAEMGVRYRVEVRGRTTQASGKEVDAVSVRVLGMGGGEYRGCSTGQRGLVDLALLAAQSSEDGWRVYDELLDGLDAKNLGHLAAYLAARVDAGQQVAVITHQPALVDAFPRARTVRVAWDGESRSWLEGAGG